MKNLFCRLTQATADATVTQHFGIYQNCLPCADTPTGYFVSNNQKSKKWKLLPGLAASVMLLLLFASAANLQAQTDTTTTIRNFNEFDLGVSPDKTIYKDNLFFSYLNSSLVWKLAKYNSNNTITLLPSPTGSSGISEKTLFTHNDSLYFLANRGNTIVLAKYNGTSYSMFNNPDAGGGHLSNSFCKPISHNGNVYSMYFDASNKAHLARFNGVTTTLISPPTVSASVRFNITFPIISFNNELYVFYDSVTTTTAYTKLARLNGNSLTSMPNPDGGRGFVVGAPPTQYNNELVLKYESANGARLVTFNGINFNIVPNPPASTLSFVGSNFVQFNNLLCFKVTPSPTGGFGLATFDGQKVTLVNNPDPSTSTSGYATSYYGTNIKYQAHDAEMIVYKNALYAPYLTQSGKGRLSKFDGSAITLINNADDTSDVQRALKIYNNKLAVTKWIGTPGSNNQKFKITLFDGASFKQWVNDSISDRGPANDFIEHQGKLFFSNATFLEGSFGLNSIYNLGYISSITSQQNTSCVGATDGWAKATPPACGSGSNTYLWTPGNQTTDSIGGLAAGTYNLRVICGTDTLYESVVITNGAGPAAPTTSNQSLCNGATVADLVATPTAGNSIVWYATATGGAALANSTPLVNATKYYAAQVTPSNCESSTRAADSVTIQATVAAKADSSYCNGSNIAVNFVGASGNTYNWTATQNGTGIAASSTGNTSFTGVNNTNAVVTDTVMVSSSFNTCTPQRDTFAISVLPTPLVDSIADMWVCPSTVVPAINFTTPITGGTVGYKWTNNNTAIGLAASGFGNIPSFTSPATTQNTIRSTINVRPYILKSATDTCFGALRTFTITSSLPPFVLLGGRFQTRVIYTGSKTINQLDISPGAGFTLNYYYQPTGGTALPGTTPVVDDTTYYVTRALAGCESNPRKIVPVNRIANDTIVFCKPDSVANLTATTAANITARWYNEPSFGDTLASSTPITAALDTLYVEEYGMYQPGRFAVISNRVPVIVMVNQTPANVVATTDKAVCNNSTVAAVNFSTTNTVGATTYAWTNNKTGIGLAATGTGNIASFTAVNNGTVPDTATIIVTPTITNLGLSCEGIKDTFLIIVNPTANVNTINNQVVCNGSAVTAINFGTTNTGGTVTYAWTNNTTSIGLAASGNGNIATFTGVNTGTAPVTATIVVTPTFTNGGVSCTGTSQTFSITVNPTANINALNDHVLCNGANFAEVAPTTTATGGTVTYAWTNNTTSIGLAASGTGNVPAFTTVNNGTAPVTATVIVTPTFANGGVNCTGTADTFYIAVNPTATVNAINNQTVCNGAAVAAVTPTTTATGGTVTYAWTNDNASIGLSASGTGTIPAFTAINTGTAPVTATITVTPTFTNNGLSCEGTVRTYTVTVNPTATVNTVSNQVICNGSASAAVNFSTTATGGTVTYAWTNSNTTIGLSASGSGNIASFTATNSGTAPVTASITVTPTFTNDGVSCQGTAQTFTITVNPTATVNAISNQTVCNGAAVSAVNFATTATGGTVTYAWTNSNSSIGIAASGTGNIASFNAINNSHVPVTATITVTPTFANGGVSCTGTAQSFTVTVNPTAVVNAVSSQIVCADATNSAVTFSSPVAGTTYSWTNSNPSIGLAASGTGNIPSFVAVNPSPNAINATITVTPNTPAGCIGQSITYTITVNGKSVAPTSISNPTPIVCANNAFATLSVNGGALGSGAVWKWYADSLSTVSIGSGATLSNIPVAKTTTYFVRAEGTCNNTAAASVVVQRANLVSHVRQHWSDVLLFDNSSRNFVAWQWYKNGVAVSGATLQQYSESIALVGTYHVVATDRNGAQFISCPLTITAGSFTGLKIGMFPNPADKGANVMVTTSFTVSELQGANITVTDVYGRVLQQITQVTANTAIKAPATTGIYVVTLTLQSGIKYSANLLTK